jgi:hypothetical protein
MDYASDQIEKQTIATRLCVSIYQMEDNEIYNLMVSLLNKIPNELKAFDGKTSGSSSVHDLKLRRQLIMAQLFIAIKNLDKDTLLERLRAFKHPEFKWIREYPRLNCFLQVDFATKSRAYRGTIRDISVGGVFIETSEPFEKGQEFSLCFTLMESDGNIPFKIKGKVTRVFPNGVGIIYKDLTHYQHEIINALIRKLT